MPEFLSETQAVVEGVPDRIDEAYEAALPITASGGTYAASMTITLTIPEGLVAAILAEIDRLSPSLAGA